MTSERSTPANERSYITSQSGQDHDRSISPATQTASEQSSLTHGNSSAAWPPGTPRNLFLYGAADRLPHQPTHPKLARLQNPDTPLYLEKPVIWPLYQCQYWDVTILCFCVNDSGSLVGDRLLGLTKLGIGLGFGRTFFIFVEEGWFDSTGF